MERILFLLSTAFWIGCVVSMASCQGLRHYWNFLHRHRLPFPCPLCQESVLSIEYERHCSQLHQLNAKLCCVWCGGRTSWPNKHKRHHVDHLLQCWRSFLQQSPLPTPPSPSSPLPRAHRLDLTPMAPKHCFFHHTLDLPPERALDPIWPLPLDPNLLPLDDASLDKAVACVRKYLDLGDQVEWFHVMVRTLAFSAFLRAMDADAGRTRTLPFSCWCDGGSEPEPPLRQHRHLIVVSSPPGHFRYQVWPQIVVADRPRKHFKCVFHEPIRSAMHLVNTLGYVCQQESSCQFSREAARSPPRRNHFYCFESLPAGYRLPLVLQWDGGLRQLLDQTYKNLKPRELVQADLVFYQSRWHVPIQHIPGIPLGVVLPVLPEFQPCRHVTDSFWYLTGHRKLYFQRHPDSLSGDAWVEAQAALGNLFYYVVGQDHWTPRPYHQTLINAFKPFVDRNRAMESDLAQRRETCSEEWKRKYEASERDVVHWKRKYEASEHDKKTLSLQVNALNDKIHQLNDKIHQLNEGEIVRLKQGLDALGQELAQVTQENKALKKENEALKKENEALKRDLDRLRRPHISIHVTKPPL